MSYGLQTTNSVLAALQTAIQGVQYNAAPAFGEKAVALFDMSDLGTAINELFVFGNRIVLVVHDNEQFTSEKKGQELHVRQTHEVVLIIADRNIGSRQIALFGNGGDTPGAFVLKDLILNAIVGPLIPGTMYCVPLHGEQLAMQKKIRDELQGRVAFTLGLRLVGGNVIVPLGRQPIV